MTTHLIAATITASFAIVVALLLHRRSAALRHAILLAALVGFIAPTPWLNQAGDKLAACLASPPAPSLLGLKTFFARASSAAIPAASPESHTARNTLLLLLWAAVFTLSLAGWLRRLLRAVPPVREANPAEAEALRRAQAGLGLTRRIDLCITTPDRVPGALGWRRPCVILPDLLSEQLSEAELHAILAHELAHVARRDNLSAAVARVIVSAFWFHPLPWWMERRMLAEREAACDELVLAHGADPADYISAILKVCRMSFAGASGYAGATGSNLQNRMEQIMSAHIVRPSSRLLRAIPGAVLVLAALLPVAGGFLRGQDQMPASLKSTTHSANDATAKKAYDCYMQHNYQGAEDLFRQIYILDPEDSRGLTGIVESYIAEGRPDDAVQLAQQESAKHPERTDLRLMLGNVYVRTEQYDRAIAEFQGILDSDRNAGKNADVLFLMAEANRRKGDLNEAIRLFQAASALSPKDTKPLVQLALLMDGTGRSDEAAPLYEQILKLDPNNPIALNNLSYLLAQKGGDPDRVLELAQKAANQMKDSAEIQDTLGMAYLKKNRPDEAVAAFRAAIESQPRNPKFHYHLGSALMPIGDRDAAIQEFQTALADNPSGDDEKQIRILLAKIAP